MPSFVADSTVLVPGLLDSHSLDRRLLVIAAYGRLRHYARVGGDEMQAMLRELPDGAQVGGRPIGELQSEAALRAELMAERLPYGTPEDVLLVLSTPILDDLEQTLRLNGIGRGLGMSAELANLERRVAVSISAPALPISTLDLPRRFSLRSVDVAVETALQGQASYIVSRSDEAQELARALAFGEEVEAPPILGPHEFIAEALDEDDLDEVDGSLLAFAGALLPQT